MEYPRAMEIKGKFLSFKSNEIHKLYDSEVRFLQTFLMFMTEILLMVL